MYRCSGVSRTNDVLEDVTGQSDTSSVVVVLVVFVAHPASKQAPLFVLAGVKELEKQSRFARGTGWHLHIHLIQANFSRS
jgi:hypothetical protein